jgi:hypothetical protein
MSLVEKATTWTAILRKERLICHFDPEEIFPTFMNWPAGKDGTTTSALINRYEPDPA